MSAFERSDNLPENHHQDGQHATTTADERAQRQREQQRQRRMNMTEQQREQEKERARVRHNKRRIAMTEQQREEERERARVRYNERRAAMTEQQLQEERERGRLCRNKRRIAMTEQEIEQEKEQRRVRATQRRDAMTEEQRQRERARIRQYRQNRAERQKCEHKQHNSFYQEHHRVFMNSRFCVGETSCTSNKQSTNAEQPMCEALRNSHNQTSNAEQPTTEGHMTALRAEYCNNYHQIQPNYVQGQSLFQNSQYCVGESSGALCIQEHSPQQHAAGPSDTSHNHAPVAEQPRGQENVHLSDNNYCKVGHASGASHNLNRIQEQHTEGPSDTSHNHTPVADQPRGQENVGASENDYCNGYEPAPSLFGSVEEAARASTILHHHVQKEAQRMIGQCITATFEVNRGAMDVMVPMGGYRQQNNANNELDPDMNMDLEAESNDDADVSGDETNIHVAQPVQERRRVLNRISRSSHNCARDFHDSTTFQRHRLRDPVMCDFCDATLFSNETSFMCCSNGQVHFDLPSSPPELMRLYTSQSKQACDFRQNIRAYNHVFAFTSMGVHIDQDLASGRDGVYTYRAQGGIYHSIGSLLPQHENRPRYLQMYIYDTEHELRNRVRESELVDPQVLSILIRVLNNYNPYVEVFRQISQHHDLSNLRLQIKERRADQYQYSLPTCDQVAAILVGEEYPSDINERDIIVETRSGRTIKIADTTGYYDPMQYPLLHPRGHFGWDLNVFSATGHRISCRAFYSYLLQVRRTSDSILLRGGRLLQQYVVDNYVKIRSQQLRYLRDNQRTIRAELYQGLQDSVAAGDTNAANIGRRTILPASFIGSPRDMRHRYYDAMALVQTFGKPDQFITMTCNPNWDEIKMNLHSKQPAQDRPDLTTRIFHAKCEELKKDIFKKGVLGKSVAHVHVIEFQKRGLPHAHMLVILDQNDNLSNPDEYDKIVRAEIPDPINEPDLYQAVVKHMIHGPCGCLRPSAGCMKNGTCKKGYPKQFAPHTIQGDDSYPKYRRRDNGQRVTLSGGIHIDNRWIVPYNPWLLRKYDCHVNVEICSSIKCVKYLYKYVYKGPDRVALQVSTSGGENQDEIAQFVDARWVCPQEAVWRIFAFPLNKTSPAVYSLQVHLPDMQNIIFNEDDDLRHLINNDMVSRTMLTQFFATNAADSQARQYLYREFPMKYTWIRSTRSWQRRRGHGKVIGRMHTVSPAEGERYYLRVLLNHVRGPQSFDHLLTVYPNSIPCSTFREAAEKLGLLETDTAIRETLLEASRIHMPSALRNLFVMVLVFCNPVGVRGLWDEFSHYMIEDYPSSIPLNLALNRLLRDLNILLMQYEKSVQNYDLPAMSSGYDVSLYTTNLIFEEMSVAVPAEDLQSIEKLNQEQRFAFDSIIGSVLQNKSSVFFIDGPGGTGKTFLYRAILAHLRTSGLIAIATATSGIAAIMMPGGRTAHSRFKIPIVLDSMSTCNIKKKSALAELLRHGSILIWDEATMMHRFAFEALDRTLRDILGVDLPFGGKVVVLGGDFRQVLPVVNRGTQSQTIEACIINSVLWQSVQVIHLTENMRARTDLIFSELIIRIGDGTEPCVSGDMIRIPDDMIIAWDDDSSLRPFIETIFPSLQQNARNTSYISERAIITPTNDNVDLLNEKIICMFPGREKRYYSYDSVDDDIHNLYQQEFLNSISPGGIPPHKLSLKIGAPIILLRNLDAKNGLCNGTRLICRGFQRNVIDAEIITGSCVGTRVFLPRIPMRPAESLNLPFQLTRKQFPIRLSFALTINKSQGQTIPHVGIYLPDHVFSHGQLYVALSRGISKNTTKVLVKKGKIGGLVGTYTKNVVYTQVLEPRTRSTSNQT